MIALKSFVVDETYMLKKKSDKKQILSNNKNKALINNLIEEIEFLKTLAKTLSLSWLSKIQNIVTNISKIKIIRIVNKLKNLSHQEKPLKSKHQTIKILATLHPSTVLKY